MSDTSEKLQQINPGEAPRGVIDSAVQHWRDVRAQRLSLDQEAAALKKDETALKSWILSALAEQNIEGVIVGGRSTGITTKEIYDCDDRTKFQQFILETRDLSLLQFRISQSAVSEHFTAGEKIPGVILTSVNDLYDRKV